MVYFTDDQSLVSWSDKQLCEVLVYFTGDQSMVSWYDKQLCKVLVYFTGDQSLVSWSDKQLCEVLVYFTGDQSMVSWYDKQLCEVLVYFTGDQSLVSWVVLDSHVRCTLFTLDRQNSNHYSGQAEFQSSIREQLCRSCSEYTTFRGGVVGVDRSRDQTKWRKG